MKQSNRYGISIELPEGDPMAAEHLLGDNWAGERWYDTAEERDAAMQELLQHPRYYRFGDSPSIRVRPLDPAQS